MSVICFRTCCTCCYQWALYCVQALLLCRWEGEGGAMLVLLALAEHVTASWFGNCYTDECPVCECAKNELDRTNILYPLQWGETIMSPVEAAQAELLHPDGSIKNHCQGRVCDIHTHTHTHTDTHTDTHTHTRAEGNIKGEVYIYIYIDIY
jgi:hypothetical protein